MTPLPSFATDTVTIVTPTESRDAHNSVKRDYASPKSATVVRGCLLEPGASQEILGGRDVTSSVWTLYLPAGTAIAATDKVVVDGVEYAIDGDPQRWTKTRAAHVVAVLKRWG